MITKREERSFADIMEELLPKPAIDPSALSCAIDWINSNMNPEQVFHTDNLNDWAERNGFVKEDLS